MKVALVGASGFIGARMVEMGVLEGLFDLVPVVRSFSSLAALARFELPWKVCDPLDAEALARAFEGCSFVVHAALGDSTQIVRMAESIYRGAERAGIQRLVVLSSASVHGQAPAIGTDETTPLHERHTLSYSNAKVRAERVLTCLARTGSVELVQLRPSIVFGPKSRWVVDCVSSLLDGSATFIDDGGGICNSIYVDNLIHAIHVALKRPEISGKVFLVRDAELVTWRDFYAVLAGALNVDLQNVHRIQPPVFVRTMKERVGDLVATRGVQAFLPFIPRSTKELAKRCLANLSLPRPPNPWCLPGPPSPRITEELSRFQQCVWHMPTRNSTEVLGYRPPVSFAEGMRRTFAWLRHVGYPIPENPPVNYTATSTGLCRL
jgi:nucleoside-diphosphate-sugar epimerase